MSFPGCLLMSSCHIRIENMSIFHWFPSLLHLYFTFCCHDDITSLEAVISFSKSFQQKSECVFTLRLSCHREMDVTYNISLFKCPIQKISNDSFNTSVSL